MREEKLKEITPVLAPQIDVNDEEVELIIWDVTHGEGVEDGTLLCTIESTKATQDMKAERPGVIYLLAKEKQKVKVGEVVAYIGSTMETIENYLTQKEKDKEKEQTGKELRYTEKAGSLADKHKIRIDDVPRKGSIIKEKDVISFIENLRKKEASQVSGVVTEKKALPGFISGYVESIGKISLHKEHIARHLLDTQNNIIFTTSEIEVCIEEANLYLEKEKESSSNINLFHLLILNVSKLLEDYKLLKSFYYEGNVFRYKDTSISFTAVDTERDYHLFTPVITYASKISIEEIALKCNELTLGVFRNEITSEQMAGGCFTLSMLTGLEIKRFTALQNQYQSAILAVGNPYEKLIMEKKGTICTKQFVNLTLSYDHRICDGYYSGQFLTELKQNIEQPNE